MVDQMSRFQKVDLGLRAPGECFISKTPDGPFIDTRLDIGLDGRPPFRGRVYLSIPIIREMAEQAGLFDEYKQIAHQATADLSELEGAAYMRGFEDGQKETDRDDTQLLDLLRDLADRLPQRDRAAVEAAVAAVEDAGEAVQHAPGNPFLVALPSAADPGQGAGAGGGKRPAGVPVNPGDGAAAAVQ